MPAIAQGQGHSQPDAALAVAPAARQMAPDQSEIRRRIPWKTSGHGYVKECARHGKKYEFKVKLHNKCNRGVFTYHLEIVRGPDRCKTVPANATRTVKWRYPGRLAKVSNGRSTGRC
ncbi:hypothetical protein [Streptomyces coffeae]|uniref:Uncharacterized protein n=1 Tax=Streptomyces coffeae TaxID=621382 RepID=A0ABS1NQ63_9ACTN|nr:hypothetical protein [Streptomyces coffeae]MBL1101995.1 hypothetical protein [Streptomyces coffeae]